MNQLPLPVGNTCWNNHVIGLCCKGTLLPHVHLVYQDHKVFSAEVLSSQSAGGFPSQVQDFVFSLAELHEVLISPFLQPAALRIAALLLPRPSSMSLIRNLNIIGLGMNPWTILLISTGQWDLLLMTTTLSLSLQIVLQSIYAVHFSLLKCTLNLGLSLLWKLLYAHVYCWYTTES